MMDADELYRAGNDMRRAGKYGEALSLYNEAVEKDPNSPARIAREMLQEQFAFFCKDYYNP